MYRLLVPETDTAKPQLQAQLPPGTLKTLKVASYTFQRGDTLSTVAGRLRLGLDTLISFNGIKDARSLSQGMILQYPNTDGLSYRVQRGDTLQGISRSYSVPLERILDWNSISTSVITPGQNVFIPGAHMNPNDVNRVLGNMFIFPVKGDISSRFGNRPDPFTGVIGFHNGIDIAGSPVGTPVAASMAGVVAQVGYNTTFGNYVILRHPGTSFQTMYAHLTKWVVAQGQSVRQGQEVGELGNTGYSTGPHLHFSIFKNGEAVDPLQYLK